MQANYVIDVNMSLNDEFVIAEVCLPQREESEGYKDTNTSAMVIVLLFPHLNGNFLYFLH